MTKEGWTTVTLGGIAENISLRVDDPSKSGLDRFVGLVHLDSGSVTVSRWDSTESVTSSMKKFQAGDVLLARRNAHLRRASAVDFEGVCSGDAYVLREKPDAIVPGLLKYILNTNRFWEYAIANADGSMSTRVKWKQLENYHFDLPVIKIQSDTEKILESIICEQMNMKNSVKEIIRIRNKLVDDYRARCRDKKSLGEIYETQLGKMLSKKSREGPEQSYYLGNINVQWQEVVTSDLNSMSFNSKEREKFQLIKGDILVCEGGEVGRCAIWNDDREMYFQKALHRLRLIENEYYPSELFIWVMHSMARRGDLRALTGGGTIPHLVQRDLKKIQLPFSEKSEMKGINDILQEIEKILLMLDERSIISSEKISSITSHFLEAEI